MWKWNASGEYSAASFYKLLVSAGRIRWNYMEIWRAAAPSKVKIFTHLLLKDKILTREVLRRRGLQVAENCVMCDEGALETAHHLFFQCANAVGVWEHFSGIKKNMHTMHDTWEESKQFYCTSTMRNKNEWVVKFMAILWSIWRQRNELIFRSTRLPVRLVANRAEEDARMWLSFCKRRSILVTRVDTGSGTRNSRANDAITLEL